MAAFFQILISSFTSHSAINVVAFEVRAASNINHMQNTNNIQL
jgi:hypothetical protein